MDASADDAGPRPDAGPSDAGRDAGGDAGPRPLDCAAELVLDTTFAVDPGGLRVQIHPSVAFDGAGIWIVYDTVEEGDTGLFDVWACRLRCDGTPAVPPFRVNTTLPFNDTDPEIAIGHGRVLVSWSSDDGTGGTDNMHAFHRVLDVEGMPLGDDVELRTTRGGAPVPDNHIASAAAVTGSGFVVSGSRAISAAPTFQLFAQELGMDGALVAGDAVEPFVDATAGALGAAIAVSGSDTWLAWERSMVGVSTQVHFTRLGSGTTAVALPGLATTAGPSIAIDAAEPTYVYAAMSAAVVGVALDVRLTDLGRPESDRPVEVLGRRGRDEVGARLSAHPDGGAAIAYHAQATGGWELLVRRFAYDGASFVVGPEVGVTTSAAPYQAGLAHVDGDVWAVTWSEGRSPDLEARLRLVTLAAP